MTCLLVTELAHFVLSFPHPNLIPHSSAFNKAPSSSPIHWAQEVGFGRKERQEKGRHLGRSSVINSIDFRATDVILVSALVLNFSPMLSGKPPLIGFLPHSPASWGSATSQGCCKKAGRVHHPQFPQVPKGVFEA